MSETKRLAEQLGVVSRRKFVIPRQLQQHADKVVSGVPDYIFVLDFESTCWPRDSSLHYPPEIIEFPVVMIRVCDGQVVSEFHDYVRPSEHPQLSEFCISFTGTSQERVEQASGIARCLQRFKAWVQRHVYQLDLAFTHFTTHHKHNRFPPHPHVDSQGAHATATFITWTDWDIGSCLYDEARRKGIELPDFLRSRVDLKVNYMQLYGVKPHSLAGAMERLGLAFHGTEHSGIDDARNTGALALRMVKDGCDLGAIV